MRKNFRTLAIFILLLGCFFIKAANAEEYAISELKYSRVGGVVIIDSEYLYKELMGMDQSTKSKPRLFNYFNNPSINLFGRFRPTAHPKIIKATILLEGEEYPAEITASRNKPDIITLAADCLDFYNFAGIEYFPMDVLLDESGEVITLTGMNLGVATY